MREYKKANMCLLISQFLRNQHHITRNTSAFHFGSSWFLGICVSSNFNYFKFNSFFHFSGVKTHSGFGKTDERFLVWTLEIRLLHPFSTTPTPYHIPFINHIPIHISYLLFQKHSKITPTLTSLCISNTTV